MHVQERPMSATFMNMRHMRSQKLADAYNGRIMSI